VIVRSGKVKDEDWWPAGDSDPYVEVRLGGLFCRTNIVEGDNTPTWNYACPTWTDIGEQVCVEN
jgi:hypothetical protein